MAKWFYMVESNSTDASREDEFNEWYDKVHLPDVLETPGFIRATRYENTESLEGKTKFLAVYEIESDDIDESLKTLRDNMDIKRAEGQVSELLVVVSRGVYRQISSLSR